MTVKGYALAPFLFLKFIKTVRNSLFEDFSFQVVVLIQVIQFEEVGKKIINLFGFLIVIAVNKEILRHRCR